MRNRAPAVELWCFLPGEWAQEVLWSGGWAGLLPQGLKAIWWKHRMGKADHLLSSWATSLAWSSSPLGDY